ncbi:MAG: hypothetical protein AAGA48_02855 [Myxococcota bacterium]
MNRLAWVGLGLVVATVVAVAFGIVHKWLLDRALDQSIGVVGTILFLIGTLGVGGASPWIFGLGRTGEHG